MPGELPSIGQYAVGMGKEFLTSKEKLWGTMVVVVLGIFLLMGISSALPAINNFLGAAIVATGKIFVLGAMFTLGLGALKLFTSEWFQTRMWYFFAGVGRAIDDRWIKSDPIGKMEVFVHEFLGTQLQKVRRARLFVEGKLEEVKGKKEEREASTQTHLATVNALRSQYFRNGRWVELSREEQALRGQLRMSREAQFSSESQRYELDATLAGKLGEKIERMDHHCERLAKLEQAFMLWVEGMQATVDFLKIDYETSRAEAEAAEALSSASRGGSHADICRRAMEFTRSEISRMTAQANTVLSFTPELTSYEVASETAGDRMMAQLSGLDQTTEGIMQLATAQHQRLTSGRLVQDLKAGRELVPVETLAETSPPPQKRKNLLRGERQN